MTARRSTITVTTDGDGNATAYSGVLTGELMAISYTKGGSDAFADGVDFDLSIEATGEVVWGSDNVNASVAVRPRGATQDTAGVDALYAGSGEEVRDRFMLVKDRIKIQIANGGSAKVGVFNVVVN